MIENPRASLRPCRNLTKKTNNAILSSEIAKRAEKLVLFTINFALEQLTLFISFKNP